MGLASPKKNYKKKKKSGHYMAKCGFRKGLICTVFFKKCFFFFLVIYNLSACLYTT